MADIESNIKVNIDTSDALSQLKLLQQQISAFQQAMKNAGAQNAAAAQAMQQNLMSSINATGKFTANIQTIKTSAESFTESLEKNKLSIGQYFKYAGGASKTFGKLFKTEFDTIEKVAVDRVKTIQTQYIKLGRDASGAMKAIAVKPLALDMDNLGTKTQIAAQKQQLFNQLMKQGSTQLLNFGKNTQWAGRQLMVGFTIPLTLMGQAAAQAYMKIEAASLKFRRVYGDMNTTTEEANKMVKSVQALANEFTKYGVAVAETMDMAATAAAMGKTGADLMAQVAQASKLAVLGQVEQQQALETTISLTNAFGVSTDELAKSVDFLNAVENQTVVSIEDLTIAIPKAAPVVKQLGGDVEDLTFFLTAMKEGGINASQGANALKSGLASMINPTKKASDFLAKFGVNIQGIVEGNKGDIKGTVVDFAKALDTLDPLNRARAIEQMFGKFQFSRLSTLFKNVIDEGSQAATVAGLSRQTAEELAILSEREMNKISDSPMFKFQKSIETMQAKLAPVGEAFLKAVTPIIEFVTKILDGFNNLSEGTKSFVSMLVLAVAGIGPVLLMTFGLIANGVANIMKLFTNMKAFINKTTRPSDILGEQTSYMNSEQLKSAAIAASLDQSHSKLRQTFTSEAAAVQQLTDAYRNAVQAQQAYSGIPGIPTGGNSAAPRKYAGGVSMVPGPAGAGDIVPALLSPGEAVIPARSAKKYAPVIRGMISGNLPGFEDGTPGAGMRQSIIGPMTQKQTEGIVRTGKTLKDISDEVVAGPYGQVPVTNFGKQVSPSPGHSFPAFGVAGIYEKPDGSKVFVKPQMDLVSAMAEIRGTTIARDAHGLVAPNQALRVMMDPTDPENKRKFLVLESALDDKISNIPTSFTKDQYFKQLVASLLRGDKDLGIGNLGGDVLADVGPAGVFQRASGKRQLGSKINSMEEQAIINLLGVKGGAKKFFAESTAEIAKSMTPAEYDAAIKTEIQAVMPKLDATIAGFGPMSKEEKQAYANMANRLAGGLGVDWTKYHAMHSSVIPRKYNQGIENVPPTSWSDLISPEVMEFLPTLKTGEMQRMHMVGELEKDENSISQVQAVLGRGATATPQNLQDFQILGNLTADVPGWINQYLRDIAPGIPSKLFNAAWNSIKGKMFSTAAASTDEKGQRLSSVYHPQVQEIENLIGNSAGLNTIVKDRNVDIATKQVLSSKSREPGPMGVVARAFSRRANLVGDIRSKLGDKVDADGEPISQTSALRQGLVDEELTLIGDSGAMIGVPGLGNKIKLGEIRSQHSSKSPEGQADIAARQRWFDETGGDMSQFPTGTGLRIRGASGFPGLFGFSTTGTVAYSETSPNWSSISDMDVFDKEKFAQKHDFELGVGGFSEILKLAKGGIVPGYANGVFSVPGPKGAGDVVPAMLSPGEAVIPAKQAAKHRPMIRQMIAGNLPGYAMGGIIPGYQYGIDNVPPGVPVEVIIVGDKTKQGMQNNIDKAQEVTEDSTNEQRKATEENKKTRRSMSDLGKSLFARTRTTGKVQMGLYGVTSALGVASTIGGPIGEAAQAAMAPVGAAAAAMSMIPGPAGMVVGGLAAIATVVGQVNEHFKKIRQESYDLAVSLGSGRKALEKYSTFAKSVNATEIMDRRREASSGQFFNIVAGKKTFGESFMEGEDGKKLIEDVGKIVKSSGTAQALESMGEQLSSAVVSGVLTGKQARSIAAALGARLNNINFGIQVSAKINNLLGPNGENLEKQPLKTRIRFNTAVVENFVEDTKNTTSMYTATGTGPAGYTTYRRKDFNDEEKTAMGGAFAARYAQLLEVQQQSVDSMEVLYQKRIDDLIAAGKTAEAIKLQNEYLGKQEKLLEKNKEQRYLAYSSLGKTDPKVLSAAKAAAEEGFTKAFEGTGMEAEALVAKTAISNMEGAKDTQKISMLSAVQTGQLGTQQATDLANSLGQTEEGNLQLRKLLLDLGPILTNRAATFAQGLSETERIKFLLNFETENPAEAEKTLDALELFRKTTGVYSDAGDDGMVTIMLNYALTSEGEATIEESKTDLDELSTEKVITITTVEKHVGDDVSTSMGKAKNFKLSDYKTKDEKLTFTTQYTSLLRMYLDGDPDLIRRVRQWLNLPENLGKGYTEADYFARQADLTVRTSTVDIAGDLGDGGDTGEDSGPAASWLDQYVKDVRDAAKGNQALTTGIAASGAALKTFGRSSNELFGLFTQLKKAGASSNIIESALGGDEETTKALIDAKTGKLKAGAQQIFDGINKVVAAQKKIDWLRLDAYEKLGKQNEMFNANLDVIKITEDKINKKYDTRIKALDEINSLNQRNAQQQQSAFSIASALARGDIAGAAQAALDKRKQDAQNAIEDQKKFYETARQTELKSVTENVNGLLLTREQIEQRILTNTNKITRNKATELETLIRIGEQAEKIYGTSKSNPTVKKASGGMIMPQRFAFGGGVFGTDTVPAMLTPGEFVVRKSAVDAIGTSKLNAINNGDLAADSVYNYTIQINVKSDSNANQIADTVLRQIERLDSQRLRGVKI